MLEPVVVPAPAAGAVETPAVSAASSPAVSAVEPTPAVAPAAAVVAPAAETVKTEDSVIGGAKAPEKPAVAEAVKPVETAKSTEAAKPVEAVKPVETAKPAEKLAEAVVPAQKNFTFEPYKVPEGTDYQLDTERVTGLNSILTEFAPDEASARQLGQRLIDFYIDDVKAAQAAQQKAWSDTQTKWKDEIRADPEIGGNRTQTVLSHIGALIENYGGDKASQETLRKAFNLTGAGNNPAVVRFMSRIGKVLAEGLPVPAQKPVAPVSTRAQRRYGGNGAVTTP